MKQGKSLRTDLILIAISGLGGFLLSLTGMSIGWMIGTLITAAFIAMRRPPCFSVKETTPCVFTADGYSLVNLFSESNSDRK